MIIGTLPDDNNGKFFMKFLNYLLEALEQLKD
jgi:hypothetical protein